MCSSEQWLSKVRSRNKKSKILTSYDVCRKKKRKEKEGDKKEKKEKKQKQDNQDRFELWMQEQSKKRAEGGEYRSCNQCSEDSWKEKIWMMEREAEEIWGTQMNVLQATQNLMVWIKESTHRLYVGWNCPSCTGTNYSPNPLGVHKWDL